MQKGSVRSRRSADQRPTADPRPGEEVPRRRGEPHVEGLAEPHVIGAQGSGTRRSSAEVSDAVGQGIDPRARQDEPDGRGPFVVVGQGRVAALLREVLGERGPEVVPSEANDLSAPWLEGARTLVVVAPAGEFGIKATKGETRRAFLVEQAHRAARAASRHGIDQVVVVTTAMVHGASADRLDIEDDDPVAAEAGGFAQDLVAFEEVFAQTLTGRDAGGTRLAVLRPAMVVGPGVDTILTRHFEAPRLLTVRGSDRPWQLLHTDDLAAAVRLVADRGLSGTFTVGALVDGEPDVVSPAELVELTGLATVTLPAATAFGAAERLHRVGVLPSPASDMAFVVHPWTVTAHGLHVAGWVPAWSSAACVEVLMDGVRGRIAVVGRRVGGRDAAALGAAGAAVALLGTAAIWRQARRR